MTNQLMNDYLKIMSLMMITKMICKEDWRPQIFPKALPRYEKGNLLRSEPVKETSGVDFESSLRS